MNVVSVAARDGHGLGKIIQTSINLIAGEGVFGDAHRGVTVKHRSCVAKDPSQPNLRQVHLIHSELLAELQEKGFHVLPGELGENVMTLGVNLLDLSAGTLLKIGANAVIQITGLRNPCHQINGHTPKLMDAMLSYAPDGSLVRVAGVMGIVLTGGDITKGNAIVVTKPSGLHVKLMPV